MLELDAQMKQAMTNLQAQHGMTVDQANTAISQTIAPIVAQIQAIQATDLSYEEKLAKVTAAVQVVADTFAPQTADATATQTTATDTTATADATAPATGSTPTPDASTAAEPASDAPPAA